jgi:hypothetical protein
MREHNYKLHLVQLNEDVLNNWRYADDRVNIFYANVKNHRFTGYLVNSSGSALYFEPEDHEGLIIVPYAWVKWCLPIEKEE